MEIHTRVPCLSGLDKILVWSADSVNGKQKHAIFNSFIKQNICALLACLPPRGHTAPNIS